MNKILLLCCIFLPLLGFSQTIDTVPEIENIEEWYTFSDPMPEFPGGANEMYKFIALNLEYPSSLIEKGIEGRVVTKFVVTKNGKLINIEAIGKANKEFSTEALRIIKKMPDWKPGEINGKAVNVSFILPIYFKIN